MEFENLLIHETRDDDIPKTLENAIRCLREQTGMTDKNDMMVLILYICMLECGFVPLGEIDKHPPAITFNYQRILTLTSNLPKGWKTNDFLYKINFVLQPFPLHICNLLCTVTAGDLLVNAYVRNVEDSNCSILLDASQYIISSNTKIQVHYQNFDILSKKFKNTVGHVVKNAILHENGEVGQSFEDLPSELVLEVVCFLDLRHMLRVSALCRRLHSVLKESKIIEKTKAKALKAGKKKTHLHQ